jgi:hypothetical protein
MGDPDEYAFRRLARRLATAAAASEPLVAAPGVTLTPLPGSGAAAEAYRFTQLLFAVRRQRELVVLGSSLAEARQASSLAEGGRLRPEQGWWLCASR